MQETSMHFEDFDDRYTLRFDADEVIIDRNGTMLWSGDPRALVADGEFHAVTVGRVMEAEMDTVVKEKIGVCIDRYLASVGEIPRGERRTRPRAATAVLALAGALGAAMMGAEAQGGDEAGAGDKTIEVVEAARHDTIVVRASAKKATVVVLDGDDVTSIVTRNTAMAVGPTDGFAEGVVARLLNGAYGGTYVQANPRALGESAEAFVTTSAGQRYVLVVRVVETGPSMVVVRRSDAQGATTGQCPEPGTARGQRGAHAPAMGGQGARTRT